MSRKKIGSIGVDSGMCFIGDPCYSIPDDASQRPNLWNRIVEGMTGKDHCSYNYKTENHEGGEGLGVCVCVTTGHGDGEYPVYAEIENGVVKSVTVKFV